MNAEHQEPNVSQTLRTAKSGDHIAVVSETFYPEINGVTNTLRHLCNGLAARGYRVSVVRPRQKNETGTEPENIRHQTIVTGLPLPGYADLRFGMASSQRLRRLWQADRPDHLYVATQGPLGVAAVTAARRLGIPVVSGFHTNFHSYCHYYGAGFLEKLLCRYGRWFHNRTGTTLAPTPTIASEVRAMGIHPVKVWGRGVDCGQFAPHKRSDALRADWGLTPTNRAVIYVGRLAAEKNLNLAISCFERIRTLHPGSRFILVGSGPMEKRIREKHPDYILCGNLRGESLASHYASGDIFLFPSKTDTFGNVVTEAMASGLAIVAFNAGAAGEHIIHGESGMVAPLDNDEAFIDHALTLADQPTTISRLGAKARKEALALDWGSRVSEFETIISNLRQEAICHGNRKQGITTL